MDWMIDSYSAGPLGPQNERDRRRGRTYELRVQRAYDNGPPWRSEIHESDDDGGGWLIGQRHADPECAKREAIALLPLYWHPPDWLVEGVLCPLCCPSTPVT